MTSVNSRTPRTDAETECGDLAHTVTAQLSRTLELELYAAIRRAEQAESRLAQALKQAEAACDAVMKRLEGRGGWPGARECKQAIRAISPAGSKL